MAVIELASFEPFREIHLTFLEQLGETIGVVLNTILANTRTEELLEQSQGLTRELQSQSEELQTQQEELQQTNKELEEQAASLRASEELLQTQQTELQQTNEELEERSRLLEIKNREVELARGALEERAEQLALSSKYKSEFLTNMSHELRTPLNSLLLLAKLLSENPEGNLSDKQVEFASTIFASGSDLLDLINDILDLSKVEAGKLDVVPERVTLSEVAGYADRTFRPLAEQKGLEFEIGVDRASPAVLESDELRLQQILKNLLSNAVKFTDAGKVELRIRVVQDDVRFATEPLARAERVLAFDVTDTGPGIPEDKLNLIFEAFQQADSGPARKHGGTGLGLSISREIARLLGGEIHVQSAMGKGSTFTLFLPARFPETPTPRQDEAEQTELGRELTEIAARSGVPPTADPLLLLPGEVADDRDEIQPGDRVVVVVEEDAELAKTLLGKARERGFKGIVAQRGDAGLALIHEFKPDAIILDLKLPVMDGSTVLDHLKHHPATRHIPVHVVAADGDGRDALRAGAVAVVEKPLDKKSLDRTFNDLEQFLARDVKNLLIVEDDEEQRRSLVELAGDGDDVEVTAVGTSKEALDALAEKRFDCVVLDLKLPDGTGFELLEELKGNGEFGDVPVIVYTGKDLTRREETKLRRYAEAIVVKDVRSPERLLDETALFLHRVENRLPAERRRTLEQLHDGNAVLLGKKILIVDDDVRNVFALTSVLEGHGMEVVFAETGAEGLEKLEASSDIDLVLMDIMLPEMDGYETMQQIRARDRFERLPVIALTAKAMKGDRQKSIAAGASDYIAKPVDTDQLLSLMRVWLYA